LANDESAFAGDGMEIRKGEERTFLTLGTCAFEHVDFAWRAGMSSFFVIFPVKIH
jgi:hypothetical protein